LVHVYISDLKLITSTGAANFRKLTKLETLIAVGCSSLGDAAFNHVVGIPTLEKLVISACPVGDTLVKELHKLPALKWLDLYKSEVTDEGFRALSRPLCAPGRFRVLRRCSLFPLARHRE